MFYETDKNDQGLPYNPYKSVVVPRPIGWVSTLSIDGVPNLAPFSQFNNLGYDPPYVMFSANPKPGGAPKDSVVNAMQTGEFVCNMATWALREAVNTTAQFVGAEIDEMTLAGLEPAPSRLVKPPRVKAAPIHLECALHQVIDLPCTAPGGRNAMVLGRVLGVHIRDEVLRDGLVDLNRIKPIARLGYMDYTAVETIFPMKRPSA